ncbi:MAG: recombinase family protein, partial [Oscillospiraceae bacterium]|nr:recombinase family protein [Oscillospiraceae bacterium]
MIAKDLSRVGRDYIQTGFYTEVYFRRKGVRFIAIGNGVDTVNPISSEFAPFMNVLNEMYLREQSKKMRTFFRQRGNSGKPTNTLCVYGYRKDPADKNHWLVDDEAATVVRRIYQLAIDCHGPYEIARILEADKVECPAYYNATHDTCMKRSNTDMSKPYSWNGVTVGNILTRPEYMGHTVNFRSSKNGLKAKRQTKPQEEWLVFKDTHEAIIPEDRWQLAQCVLAVRRRTDSTGEANPLTGKLHCAECGAKLNNHRSRAKQSGRESDDYYDCPTY